MLELSFCSAMAYSLDSRPVLIVQYSLVFETVQTEGAMNRSRCDRLLTPETCVTAISISALTGATSDFCQHPERSPLTRVNAEHKYKILG